jgi:hypothetical protein
MTHTHLHVPRPEPQRNYRLEVAAGAVVLVLMAIYAVNQMGSVPRRTAYSYTYGKVIETRIAVTGTRETLYGGRIYYQIESHVTFDLNGKHQDRWMPASDVITAREVLMAQLAQQPTKCRVYWPPEHPQDLKCQLE